MGLCADPRKAAATGLSARVLRALGIGVDGLDSKEERHRRLLKERLLREIRPHEVGDVTLPGFGLHSDFPGAQQRLIYFSADLLNDVARKIIRGCEYIMGEKRIVEPPYEIDLFMVQPGDIPHVIQILEPMKKTHIGPGFRVTRIVAIEDPKSALYEIVVWDTWTFYSSIVTP
jgi:hypothetical protein